jgi:acyl carrier protein
MEFSSYPDEIEKLTAFMLKQIKRNPNNFSFVFNVKPLVSDCCSKTDEVIEQHQKKNLANFVKSFVSDEFEMTQYLSRGIYGYYSVLIQRTKNIYVELSKKEEKALRHNLLCYLKCILIYNFEIKISGINIESRLREDIGLDSLDFYEFAYLVDDIDGVRIAKNDGLWTLFDDYYGVNNGYKINDAIDYMLLRVDNKNLSNDLYILMCSNVDYSSILKQHNFEPISL